LTVRLFGPNAKFVRETLFPLLLGAVVGAVVAVAGGVGVLPPPALVVVGVLPHAAIVTPRLMMTRHNLALAIMVFKDVCMVLFLLLSCFSRDGNVS